MLVCYLQTDAAVGHEMKRRNGCSDFVWNERRDPERIQRHPEAKRLGEVQTVCDCGHSGVDGAERPGSPTRRRNGTEINTADFAGFGAVGLLGRSFVSIMATETEKNKANDPSN